MKKTALDSILNTLKRGPKRGLTAETVSDRAGVKLSTTRSYLSSLVREGDVFIVGTAAPTFGRPANFYALKA